MNKTIDGGPIRGCGPISSDFSLPISFQVCRSYNMLYGGWILTIKQNKKLHTTRHTPGAHDTLKLKKNSCKVSYITSLTVIFPIYITWFVITYVIEHTICDCILY